MQRSLCLKCVSFFWILALWERIFRVKFQQLKRVLARKIICFFQFWCMICYHLLHKTLAMDHRTVDSAWIFTITSPASPAHRYGFSITNCTMHALQYVAPFERMKNRRVAFENNPTIKYCAANMEVINVKKDTSKFKNHSVLKFNKNQNYWKCIFYCGKCIPWTKEPNTKWS